MTMFIYDDNLKSERLYTRFLNEKDFKIWSEFFEDQESVEFLPVLGSSSLERATHMIGKQLERYAAHRFGHQALIDKETNDFIGLCGLLTQEIDGKTEIEVGYHILKKHWGKGYAPEAAKMFIDYAFKNNLCNSIVSVIDTGNVKSQRVAQKNGLKIEKEIKYQDDDVYIYRIEKTKWEIDKLREN